MNGLAGLSLYSSTFCWMSTSDRLAHQRLIGNTLEPQTERCCILVTLEELVLLLAADHVTLQKASLILLFLQRQLQFHPILFIS